MKLEHSRRHAWLFVFLVFLFMLINFADKAVIGLSAVSIMKELHLTHTQFGLIGSSFFFLFSISGVIVGYVANRVKTKNIMLVMAVIWALTQLPMIGTVSLTVLIASRIVLGAGEGPAFPVGMHAIYKWFEDKRRTVPTSIVACGAAFGAGVIAPAITWIITTYSWHAAFGTLGVAGLIWSIVWFFFSKEGPLDEAHTGLEGGAEARIPYRNLLLSRTALGVFIGGFAAYWALTLNIVWLAAYLVKGVHFTPTQAGWIIVLPSMTQIVLAPSLAFLSQRMVRHGISSRVARGVMAGLCVLIGGTAMICLPFVPVGAAKIIFVALAFSMGSIIFTLGSTLIGEISPASQRGAMLGITNSIHTLAGLLAPVIMGHIVDVGANPAAGFRTGFVVAGALIGVAGVITMLLINPTADLARFARRSGLNSTANIPVKDLDATAH
jgi:MFS transporter, ACS family, D-galactonate transporter